MSNMMRAARLHGIGERFRIDNIPIPDVRPTDVLVEVKAAGVVPNLRNVVTSYPKWFPYLPLPKFPAIFGLDSAGVVAAVGSQIRSGIEPGDRVYINPGLSCGSCLACRRADPINCPAYTFQGYFGFGQGSEQVFEDYPYGGFGQFLTAPAANLVKLPESISFEQAARFGYLGTAYAALEKAQFAPGQSVLIDGATGTLGLCAVVLALAMGASKIFGTGRNEELLERIRNLDPTRVIPLTLGGLPIADSVMAATGAYGVDVLIESLGANAPPSTVLDSFEALRRGGIGVNIGGVADPVALDPFRLMCLQKSFVGSLWFTAAQGEDMVALADAGLLDLSVFQHERFTLEEINEALDATDQRTGGFTNVVITH